MKTYFTLFVTTFLLTVSAYPQPQDSIFVIISGDTVHIWNTGAFENCASLFSMNVSTSNDTIYMTEVDTAEEYVFCLCYFDLNASVTGLQSGNYVVMVYREFPLVYPDTSFYIGSTSFYYGGSTLNYLSKSYQSDCYNITNEKEDRIKPGGYVLFDNYPNPFNPSTVIKYQIPELSFVTLKIFDVLGNEIVSLVNEEKQSGSYEVEFYAQGGFASSGDAYSLPSGIYFYSLKVYTFRHQGSFVDTKKMILMK
jgi:hypothetical protein